MTTTRTATTEGDIRNRAWFAERLDAGDTIAAIGEQAGVSRQTASSWGKRHGLTGNKRAYTRPSVEQMTADYKRHGSIRPMSDEYGISPAVMRTWLFEAHVEVAEPRHGGGRPAANVDVSQIHQLRNDGATWHEIADQLGVSYETARRKGQEHHHQQRRSASVPTPTEVAVNQPRLF